MASSLVAALDTHTPLQLGEKGHVEHGWSNDIQERIIQLSFQITRTTPEGVSELGETFYNIAFPLRNVLEKDAATAADGGVSPTLHVQQEKASELVDVLRRMVLQTRDIEGGKGEWALGRELLRQWYRIYPQEALKMIKYYVQPLPLADTSHPFGSWKDIKFLWRVFGGERCPAEVLGFMVTLVNTQLRQDLTSAAPSLAARWISRENGSKKDAVPFKPFFQALAEDYFKHYLTTARTPEKMVAAKRKAYMDYRKKVLVPLNKKLRTPQMKQCAGQWAEIDYKKDVTSVTLRKQTKAFLNQKKDGTERTTVDDRIVAAANFQEFVDGAVKSGEGLKGKRVGINTLAHDAWNYATSSNHLCGAQNGLSKVEVTVLNEQWKDSAKLVGNLSDYIPMIDLSGSMSGDPMDAAMGIGLRIAEKSNLGKRALTFSSKPHWMNFDGCETLTEMMSKMAEFRSDWQTSTNFTAALKMILDMCVQLKLPADKVAAIKLVILSDMQIDDNNNEGINETMWGKIERMYAEAGVKAVGQPYKPGHIIFWNLKHTKGFPTLSTTPNTTMFAGFSPVLLNEFVNKGVEYLMDQSPWGMLVESLNKDRYNVMDFA